MKIKIRICRCMYADCSQRVIPFFFQTKTGFPNALQEKWENDPGNQGNHLHNRIRDFYLLPNFLSNKEKGEYLKDYKMVTFGRHPFVRLVSTYKDKVIDGLNQSYRKMMNYDKNQPYSVKYFLTFPIVCSNRHFYCSHLFKFEETFSNNQKSILSKKCSDLSTLRENCLEM